MLKLLEIKQKINNIITQEKKHFLIKNKNFSPTNREWFNSIYAYNKNTIKSLPTTDNLIVKLIKTYFNMYNLKLEKKINIKEKNTRLKRLSTNRIFISRADLKHTVDKAIITMYVYNRQRIYYINKLNDVTKLFLKGNYFFKRIMLIRPEAINISLKINREKDIFIKELNWNDNTFRFYEKKYSNVLIKNFLKKELLYMYLKEILLFNEFKFRNAYLLPLKTLFYKIYKKKIEFNLISLKYFHFNADIFLQILAIKLRKRKNRILRVMKTSLRKIRIPLFNKIAIYNNKNFKESNKDYLMDYKFNKYNLYNKLYPNLGNYVINSLKNKTFSGIRLEASGRLTKRITAARSLFKFKYLGNLRNIDYSYKGSSSVILRGNLKSNLQYTKLKSKTRIGSFGLKGWINSI